MRKCKCKKCGCEFQEDDSNPNIHYSNPSDTCPSCQRLDRTEKGGYYQDKNGEYHKK